MTKTHKTKSLPSHRIPGKVILAAALYTALAVYLFWPYFNRLTTSQYILPLNFTLAALGCFILSKRWISSLAASLIAGACELGALAGGSEWRDPQRRFGTSLGAAFQMADDLLDYTATEQATGKPVGQDLREHKITLPLISALPRMSQDERRLVEALMADPSPGDSEIAAIVQVVEERGGITTARERAMEMAHRAEAELVEVQPGTARDALMASITYCVERGK